MCLGDASGDNAMAKARRDECPRGKFIPAQIVKSESKTVQLPSMKALGPLLWEMLHTVKFLPMADLIVSRVTARLPCGICKAHWAAILAADPPDFSSLPAYRSWTVRAHNAVNRGNDYATGQPLNRPQWTDEQAAARWGW